jgi:hypothetical protein
LLYGNKSQRCNYLLSFVAENGLGMMKENHTRDGFLVVLHFDAAL